VTQKVYLSVGPVGVQVPCVAGVLRHGRQRL